MHLWAAFDNQMTWDFPAVHIVKAEHLSFNNGGFADIWKAAWKESCGNTQELAVKVPRCTSLGSDSLVKLRKRLIQECYVRSAATHPNITPFLGISFDFDRPGVPCLVSPYYQHGDITSYLKEHPHINKLPLIKQIASALSYLHGLSIIHGEVKGSNILINDKHEACLNDFGHSRTLKPHRFNTRMTPETWRFVTPELMSSPEEGCTQLTTEAWRWKAPEVIRIGMDATTPATEVWAFAMTVIEILTGFLPFSHITNDASVVLAVISGSRPKREHCPRMETDIWNMVESCWDVDPNQRPSMAGVAHFFALQSTQFSRL